MALLRQKYALAIYFVVCGGLECYLFLSGALFIQYTIITMPQLILLLNEIVSIKETSAVRIFMSKILSCKKRSRQRKGFFCCLWRK